LLKDWSDIGRYVAAGRQFVPDPGAAMILDRKYQLWRESYRRLQTMFPLLTART
jgi:hypothetical protein